mmetsp:Transcript_10755/g.45127  ORF Transcript_10755/g.45127 Transcript_10755/m.45127 type:complete len:329 (-) Transcript_10755:446-1432(-)
MFIASCASVSAPSAYEDSVTERVRWSHTPCPTLPFIIPSGTFATARSTFTVRHRPFTFNRTARAETSPASLAANATTSFSVSKRTPHVTCAPTLFRGGRDTQSLWSIPRHASTRLSADLRPSARCRRSEGTRRTSRHAMHAFASFPSFSFLTSPAGEITALSFSSARRPTPGRLRTGRDATYASASFKETSKTPFGFARIVASLAISRLGPIPTDATQPVSSRTRLRTNSANSFGVLFVSLGVPVGESRDVSSRDERPPPVTSAVTSMYASSTLTPMTCGVTSCRIRYTSSATAEYFSNSYGITTRFGHRASASATRPPARQPKARAS